MIRLPFAAFLVGAVLTVSGAEIAGRKMAWAHYVPWYKPENASLAAADFYNFPLETVDERESRTVSTRREIERAMASGIDGWMVDLGANPPKARMNSSWDMAGYLAAAEETPFQVAICLDGRGTPEYFAREIVRMLREFGDHPNYPKMKGRPVVSTYSFLRHTPEQWNETMRLVRAEGLDPHLVANANPWPEKPTEFKKLESCLGAFEAVYMFDAPGHAKDPPEVTNRELREWCAAHGKMAVPSLHPGYWGAWLKGHNDYYHPFRGMDMLYRMYESGKAAGPVDWIHVTTWNDLCETALMPCVFTPGVTRLVHAYCDGMKGLDVAANEMRINFAYHREELVGAMLRIEAMALPRRGGEDVRIRGVLLGYDGGRLTDLEPRHLKGEGFVRCEWLIPTAALSEHQSVTPCFCVESDGVVRQATLPSVLLVSGWIQNAVTVNVPFDRMMADFRPKLTVSQAGDVLAADLDVRSPEPLRRAILFRNDRPFAAFTADAPTGEAQRVIRMDGIDGALTLSVSNGRILRAVKNYERNGRKTWQWRADGLVTRQNPKWSVHALVVSGGEDLKIGVEPKGGARLDEDGPDLTVMNAPAPGVREGVLSVRRKASAPAESDGFWALLETESGRFHCTPVVWPFDVGHRLTERSVLETATTLETSCGGSGYALRGGSEFLTPPAELPVKSNRIVRCRLPWAGTRTQSWSLVDAKGVFGLPPCVWPHGTERISFRVRIEASEGRPRELIHQEGWRDGITVGLDGESRIMLSRGYETGTAHAFDRVVGRTRLEPGRWHDILVEGDMACVRLSVDGCPDAEFKPTPVRSFGGCRIFVGGKREAPSSGVRIERLSVSGL